MISIWSLMDLEGERSVTHSERKCFDQVITHPVNGRSPGCTRRVVRKIRPIRPGEGCGSAYTLRTSCSLERSSRRRCRLRICDRDAFIIRATGKTTDSATKLVGLRGSRLNRLDGRRTEVEKTRCLIRTSVEDSNPRARR